MNRNLSVIAMTSMILVCCIHGSAVAEERFKFSPETYGVVAKQSAGHPNERARWNGIWSYSNQQFPQAREHFERAARYADKPSQFVLGMMHWHGEGGSRDPVTAYIWIDLACERGTTAELIVLREKMWESLTHEQKAQVHERGPEFFRQFGDAVTMARTNAQIRRFSTGRTGSRTGGSPGTMSVSLGNEAVDTCATSDSPPLASLGGSDIYAACRTDPEHYWREQEHVLKEMVAGARVGER